MIEINLKNRASTQTTFSFNSMCRFGDVYLGATDDGLFRICGQSDDGVEIPALMRSGMFDLGTENQKRVRAFYFGLETNGELKLSVFCDGTLAGTYTVKKTIGIQDIKVTISRSHVGRYWQWQIENVDGAFFVLYSIKVLPIILSR